MGRWDYSNKEEADNLKKIEIWWLKKYGYFNDWKSGGIEWKGGWSNSKSSIGIIVSTSDNQNYIRFQYTQTERNGEQKSFDYKVKLTTTSCNYGGKRYWFICPLSKDGVPCNRRVGVLYKSSDYFGCRHCYDLTYNSRNENRNYKYYPLFNTLTLKKKAEDLEKKIKRPYYAGKPTKKQIKLEKIYDKFFSNSTLLRKIKGI